MSFALYSISPGFDKLQRLDVSQNTLSGTLPANLPKLRVFASLLLSVFDNLYTGTVPASYASISALALAYNPGLVGAFPSGFTTSKLWVWSAYFNLYYNAANMIGTASYGMAPNYGSGILYGTSIGLDRPLVDILRDVQAALDPSNTSALAASWGSTHLQACTPYKSSNAPLTTYPGQAVTQPGYGRSWLGVTCQDGPGFIVTAAAVGAASNVVLFNMSLRGTLPVQLRELKTASTISVSLNALSGTMPSCWCAQSAACVRSYVHAPARALLGQVLTTPACIVRARIRGSERV